MVVDSNSKIKISYKNKKYISMWFAQTDMFMCDSRSGKKQSKLPTYFNCSQV